MGDDRTPWPYLTVKAACRLLNVRRELVEGLAVRGDIRAVRSEGRGTDSSDLRAPGAHQVGMVWLVNREDVYNLRDRIAQG